MSETITAYAINLPRETERKRVLQENFRPYPFIHLEFITADQGEYQPIELEQYYQKQLDFRTITKGEVGCFRSHQKAMALFLATDAPFCLIVEDDCMPLENEQVSFGKTIKEVIDYCENRTFDIMNISSKKGVHYITKQPLEDNAIIRYSYFAPGTVAYFISRTAAQKIIHFPILASYDVMLQCSGITNVELYHLKHRICVQNPAFDSNIDSVDMNRDVFRRQKRKERNALLHILGKIKHTLYKRYIIFGQNVKMIGWGQSLKGSGYEYRHYPFGEDEEVEIIF